MQTGQFLREWREQLRISARAVAERADTSSDRLKAIESGSAEPSLAELESFARTLGLKLEDLLEDEIPRNAAPDPIRFLMKSAEAFSPGDEVRLRVTAAARAGLDLLSLRQRLGIPLPGFAKFTPRAPTTKKSEPLHEEGSALARDCRKEFAIEGRIDSVRNLLSETLRIPIIAAKLTDYGPDAFSVYAPGSGCAVVLNIDGKNENKLVARFSLLHELAHVLFDRPAQGAMGFACEQRNERSLAVEVRANAFAMRMLLPQPDLRRILDRIWEPVLFRRVIEEWGVHRTALVKYAGKLQGFEDGEAEQRAPQVDTSAPLHFRDAEELEGEKAPLDVVPIERRGEFARLVIQGVREGKLSHGEARQLLRVSASVDVGALAERLDLPLEA